MRSTIYKSPAVLSWSLYSLFPILQCENNRASPLLPSTHSPSKSWRGLWYQYPGQPFSSQFLISSIYVKVCRFFYFLAILQADSFLSMSLGPGRGQEEVSENNWIWNRMKLNCYTIKCGSSSPWIIAVIYLIPNPWYYTIFGRKQNQLYNNVLLLHLQKCTAIILKLGEQAHCQYIYWKMLWILMLFF